VSTTALLVADAGPEDGLGHLSRLSAIVVALRARGFETRCHVNGASVPFERDGVNWSPWPPGAALRDVDVVILDSYRLEPDSVLGRGVPLVLFRDDGDASVEASLVISVAALPSDDPPRLCGPRYAALRPSYWGLPPKATSRALSSVLVTTGAGDRGGMGIEFARGLFARLPDTNVTLVCGPSAPALAADGLRLLAAPESLFEHQLIADLVICGGGQTMLETAACGTPCIALVLAENQRGQALRLASSGAVVAVDPADLEGALAAVGALDGDARRELSRRAQQAVDGYGALRIAFHIEALLRRAA
jgi:spore coat polysaccharide biosynthesis predicted glycosyltransferase SpsG